MQQLRIVTYNVRYFGHATRGIASTRTAMSRIADAIAELDPLPSIVCLQEVETRSLRSRLSHRRDQTQLERFMEVLAASLATANKPDEYEAHYFPAHAYRLAKKAHVYTTGLAILAHSSLAVDRHNASTPHEITHRRMHPIKRFKQTRICAHVRLRARSGSSHDAIDVFNTHLSLPSTLSREFWTQSRRLGWGPNQVEEAKSLVSFVDRERGSDRFIVVGDFNALPGSPVYQGLVEQTGWVDAFARRYRLSLDELVGWPTAGFMRMRMHLDHVFSGPALKWLDFDETEPFGHRSARFHGLSDHVPLIGRCRLLGTRSLRPPA